VELACHPGQGFGRVILAKDSSAFSTLIQNVRNIYMGTGIVILLMAGALSIYLRYAIGRPIGQMVAQFREGKPPNYQGIREFEFLSDNIGQMMLEIAEHRDRLEELVNERTAELENARTQLTDALENISEGFAFYDGLDRLVLCNNRFREIMRPPGTENLMVPGTSFEAIVRAAAGRGLIRDAEGRVDKWVEERLAKHRKPGAPHIHQRGDGRWVQISERKTESGGTVAVYTDITNIKLAEIDLRQLKEDAEQANKAKTEFLRNITHDIRTPMNSITGFARKVMEHSKDNLPTKQFRNLERILVSSDHLFLLINDLLDLSSIETGKMNVQPSEIPLAFLVNECVRFFKHEPKFGESRLRLVNEVEDENITIRTDDSKLKQILVNLLSNAIKFTESGEITVSAQFVDGSVSIAVADTGIGIPEDQLELVFDEFHQVSHHSGKQPGGTGLGLAISRKLAGLLGGDVTVQSAVGVGSTFTVTIPVLYNPTTAEREPRIAAESKGDVAV
jgi:signal transduction histidine kinase